MSATVFAALEVQPLLDRVFTKQEDDEHAQVAVLSHGAWQNRFHRDLKILGTKILLDRKPYVVTGVMPRNFEFPLLPGHLNRSELWVPLSLQPQELTARAASWTFQMVGRLILPPSKNIYSFMIVVFEPARRWRNLNREQ
jgi:hypothetical protein